MHVLVISGSPRGISKVPGHENAFIDLPRPGGVIEPVPVDSCSERLADAFIEGATEAGHVCVKKTLHELRHIEPCRACYGCLRTKKCVLQDDMQKLYDEFDRTWRSVFGEIGWTEKGILHAPRFKDHAETYLRSARNFGRSFA